MIHVAVADPGAMLSLAKTAAMIPRSSERGVGAIRELEAVNLRHPQLPAVTYHLIHAGMYARTLTLPAGSVLTGALIKRATILIFNGDATIATGEGSERLSGFHVIAASAHRKQAFLAHGETTLTMIFPSSARDIEAAEAAFTDEADRLFSRYGENVVTITEE